MRTNFLYHADSNSGSHCLMRRKIPELLAPAGGPEAFHAAIAAGADAVYLGGSSFSARHYASNFSPEEMEEAVDYAHLRNVKVYVTVNTVIKDLELPAVIEYLLFLYSIGIDAVLLQDIGLSVLAGSIIPCLPLHASTQMTIHNIAGAEYAESLGFERIVLARELSAGEVFMISESLENAGIEIFVHGALCFCYSGDCLLSAMIGGRSGNRGMCAQPCRKKYRLTWPEKDRYGRMRQGREICSGYLMSMKDLSLYDTIEEVITGLAIDSLKIEGRMKSPEYVAVVTDVYRRALDAISGGNFEPLDDDRAILALAFNREFTPGYLCGFRDRDLISPDRPGNRGLFVGCVVGYDDRAGLAEILPENNILPSRGDGLLFMSTGFEEGMILRQDPVNIGRNVGLKTTIRPPAGAAVYITKSRFVPDKAREIIAIGEGRKKIPVALSFRVGGDGTAVLGGYFLLPGEKTIYVESVSGFRMETALTRPLLPDQVRDQLMKAGGTIFEVTGIDLDLPENLFTPISNLNRLRRRLFELAEEEITEMPRPDPADIETCRYRIYAFRSTIDDLRRQKNKGGITGLSCYTDSIEAVEAAVRGGANTIYYEIPSIAHLSIEEIKNHLSLTSRICESSSVKPYWKFPDIIRQDLLDKVLIIAEDLPNGMGIMTGDAGASYAIRMRNPGVETVGSAFLNICNHLSVNALSPIFDRLTISPELTCGEIRDMVAFLAGKGAPSLELLVQGNIEVMISENSISSLSSEPLSGHAGQHFGLVDESGRLFPVSIDSSGRTHIRNADELCLFDLLPEIFDSGPLSIAVDARDRPPRYAEEMLRFYRKGIDSLSAGHAGANGDIASLMESVRKISNRRITSGFFRKE